MAAAIRYMLLLLLGVWWANTGQAWALLVALAMQELFLTVMAGKLWSTSQKVNLMWVRLREKQILEYEDVQPGQ